MNTPPACHLCQEPCDCDRCRAQRAAPDLLTALLAMEHAYGIDGLGSDRIKAHALARAAIAKARP